MSESDKEFEHLMGTPWIIRDLGYGYSRRAEDIANGIEAVSDVIGALDRGEALVGEAGKALRGSLGTMQAYVRNAIHACETFGGILKEYGSELEEPKKTADLAADRIVDMLEELDGCQTALETAEKECGWYAPGTTSWAAAQRRVATQQSRIRELNLDLALAQAAWKLSRNAKTAAVEKAVAGISDLGLPPLAPETGDTPPGPGPGGGGGTGPGGGGGGGGGYVPPPPLPPMPKPGDSIPGGNSPGGPGDVAPVDPGAAERERAEQWEDIREAASRGYLSTNQWDNLIIIATAPHDPGRPKAAVEFFNELGPRDLVILANNESVRYHRILSDPQAAYEAYLASGGDLTYEEWLASVHQQYKDRMAALGALLAEATRCQDPPLAPGYAQGIVDLFTENPAPWAATLSVLLSNGEYSTDFVVTIANGVSDYMKGPEFPGAWDTGFAGNPATSPLYSDPSAGILKMIENNPAAGEILLAQQ